MRRDLGRGQRLMTAWRPPRTGTGQEVSEAITNSSSSGPSTELVSMLTDEGISSAWLSKSNKLDDLSTSRDGFFIYNNQLTKRPAPPISKPDHDRFPYKPLKSGNIRLLRIHGSGSSYSNATELRCELIQAPLDDVPEYAALSYPWGSDPSCRHSVLINWKSFNVTNNLYAALLMLKRQQGNGLYWVDAICINQNDYAEKNIQIGMMGRIYQSASRVHIWLGEVDSDTHLVEPFIRTIVAAYSNQQAAGDARKFPSIPESSKVRYGYPPASDPGYRALDRFLNSPWCSRIWIVQELALAKDFVFHRGPFSVDPGLILTFVASHIHPGFNHPDPEVNRRLGDLMLVSIENTRITEHKGTKLLALLLRHRTALAKFEQDKVYGLLGIASDVVSGRVVIDVDVRKSPEEVYQDTAMAIIKADKNLNILSAVDNRELPTAEGDLPSWVPDWRARGETGKTDTFLFREPEPSYEHRAYFRTNATPGTSARPQFDGKRMTVRCLFVDKIVDTGSVLTRDHPLPPYPDWETVTGARSKQPYLPTGESMIDVYYHTMTMDTCRGDPASIRAMYKHYDEKRWAPLRKLFDRYVASTGSHIMTEPDENRDRLVIAANEDPLFQYMGVALNRRMAKTGQRKLIALVPGIAEEGDYIVLCEGSPMPLVLRRKGRAFNLVGDCYARGIMKGELWTPNRMDRVKEIVLE